MTDRRAFSLVELLVVIAIIVSLLGLLAPTCRHVLFLVDLDICYSNVRQLSVAWAAYQADYDRALVNGSTHGADPWAKWGDETPTNPNRYSLITTGALFPHTGQTGIYLCPADPVEHVRSYSITSLMNGWDWGDLPYVTMYNQIRDPANQMVFVDEKDRRSWSNMGTFAQDPKCWNKNRWVDYVANFHDGGDNVGFADGHAEHWKWTDPRTFDASEKEQFYYPDNGNPDLLRIRKSFFNEMQGAY
jgi:prepilin-type N-terminal cleavage/methylation domain-containing protein/prepilin-type processing-associated H-X9-DG protein